MNGIQDMQEELKRIHKVSDTLCTAHASLRDRFARRAFILDVTILGLSLWLVALGFVDSRLNLTLTPFGLDTQLWMGLLAVGTFFLAIVQMKTDWKGRSDAHKRTLEIYAEVKREAGYLMALGKFEESAWRRVLARYDLASSVGIAVPEKDFLRQKQRHKVKIALSKHLDDYPFASPLLARARYWLRDNTRKDGSDDT